MTNITLSIPDETYASMKLHREIRWSEVVRRAITEFIGKLEERGSEATTRELLEELGEDFRKSLSGLGFEKAAEGYEKMR
ncbi:MAG TPA: hypothetical protein HA257_05685, partial [Candidatus Methanoperedenaceae archaeon]|nr:hypothetical protein [Candidatus Methanoperedenaceae archaeon]